MLFSPTSISLLRMFVAVSVIYGWKTTHFCTGGVDSIIFGLNMFSSDLVGYRMMLFHVLDGIQQPSLWTTFICDYWISPFTHTWGDTSIAVEVGIFPIHRLKSRLKYHRLGRPSWTNSSALIRTNSQQPSVHRPIPWM